MTPQEIQQKIKEIHHAKNDALKNAQYEKAAMLRDEERKYFEMLEVDKKNENK